MGKRKLLVDNGIILANAKRIETGKEVIKDKKHLAELIAAKNSGSKDNIYMQLYRSSTKGFVSENKDLVDSVCAELNLPREVLLSNI